MEDLFLPYTNRVYIVGGAIRDYYLNNNIVDIDIEVFGIDVDTFDTIMTSIGANGIGKSFFVYKYKNCIDISLPRLENKSSFGHKGFDVILATNEYEATIRRDFTINAMMLNIYTLELLDFHNGISDIDHKSLRIVNEQKFKEDSLRVLRCMQFASRFCFRVEKQSMQIMQDINISDLSKERVYIEFEKFFLSQHLEYGFYYLLKLNIFNQLFNKNISFKDFMKIYKFLKKYKKNFEAKNYKYYFAYILSQLANIDIDLIIKTLHLPNEYKKILKQQPKLDQNISTEELLIISLELPIRDCLLNIYQNIKNKAIKYDIYDTTIKTPFTSAMVIQDGFVGADISKELKVRKLNYIKTLSNQNKII